jgi:HEAT repeat protein
LVRLLGSPLADLRKVAATALAETGVREAEEALRPLATDPDVEVRKAAIRALGILERLQ